jgi:hypothetical protein
MQFVDQARTYRYVVSYALRFSFMCVSRIIYTFVSLPAPMSKSFLMEYLNYVLPT